ncbi:MAG: glycosyltransferase [Planctomycetes bacterium]|nr:glycosyltransferase [Planctomycetota bacterium]
MLPFRVGLDVWPALRHAPGIGRYTRELVRALAPLDERPELALFEVGPGRATLAESTWNVDGRPGIRRVRANVSRRWLDVTGAFGLGAERWCGGVGLFQRAFVASPRVGRVPQIVPVFELPERGSRAEFELARTLSRVAHALVASDWAAAALVERFALEPERIHRVPVGCDHWRRDLGRDLEPVDPPRVLVLGAVAKRRNPLALVAALERLAKNGRELELVFCGRRGDAAEELDRARAASKLGARLKWIDEPVERDLPELVAGASVLFHSNVEECTAVTPLEALSLGVAVVAARLDTFREALGEHATYVAPRAEPDELARALEQELARSHDPAERRRRRDHAAPFTWDANARATVRVWRTLLAR